SLLLPFPPIPLSPIRLSQSRQILMHELNCDGSLADRGGAALDRTVAGIAGDEDAGDAGLEQEGIAAEVAGPVSARLEVGTGEDEAFGVADDLGGEPSGLGLGA